MWFDMVLYVEAYTCLWRDMCIFVWCGVYVSHVVCGVKWCVWWCLCHVGFVVNDC
jgi:hypothetical protein